MAEPFKERVNAEAVGRIAAGVSAVWPAFSAEAFVAAVVPALAALELKDRVALVADALAARLPRPFPEALRVLVAALPDAPDGAEDVGGGMWLWPVLTVVERHGVGEPEASLAALREMTSRFSAEFAVRPILVAHPALAYATFAAWAADPNVHVRRLVSEGSRPRLPWGQRLPAAVSDPTRGLALIERLVDDPAPYVRRSVANHLGDVAKDHPERAVAVAQAWIAANPSRAAVARHGLRDLLKKGHAGALALFGEGGGGVRVSGLRVTPAEAAAGGKVEVRAEIEAVTAGAVRVDVVWRWPGARGGTGGKTFRGAVRQLAGGETWSFRSTLSLRPVSTRPLRPGEQQVWLRVGGEDVGPAGFRLLG